MTGSGKRWHGQNVNGQDIHTMWCPMGGMTLLDVMNECSSAQQCHVFACVATAAGSVVYTVELTRY